MTTDFPVAMTGTTNTLLWADEWAIENTAREQLRRISQLPWVERLAVMPDVHFGKGATVGSVIGMRNALSPSAVGVDIGCGVSAVRTSATVDDLPESLAAMRARVESMIPVGFNAHDGHVNVRPLGLRTDTLDRLWRDFSSLHKGVQDRQGRALSQMGTLGGGNHFLEVCSDDNGAIWLTLHSGSRNIGKELAERHIAIAKDLPQNEDLPDRDLAVFLAGTPEMTAYRRDLQWAQDYAASNRLVMMALFESAFKQSMPGADVTFGDRINCHHNYVATEIIDGQELIVTRKGAIRAGSGDLGVIPGSMGTGSFIVEGLGSERSMFSASHGAGRRMSRGAAKRTYTVKDLAEQTMGIECRKDQGVVDEIPGAYKDIETVIKDQSDLVKVKARLQTLMCVKG